MTTATIDRPAAPSAEWNHSCTDQCPNPCPAASSLVDTPEIIVPESPAALTD